jgi:hypothetical protein
MPWYIINSYGRLWLKPYIFNIRLCNTIEINYTIMVNLEGRGGGLGEIVTKIEGIIDYNNVGRNWGAGRNPPAPSSAS